MYIDVSQVNGIKMGSDGESAKALDISRDDPKSKKKGRCCAWSDDARETI